MGKYALVVALLVGLSDSAFARDDGRYANELLKNWFDNLTSSNGKCCFFADGFSVSDVDWDTEEGHYRVLLHGEWVNVPNSSVVTELKSLRSSGRLALHGQQRYHLYSMFPAWSRRVKVCACQ